jgi:hypothetical protein
MTMNTTHLKTMIAGMALAMAPAALMAQRTQYPEIYERNPQQHGSFGRQMGAPVRGVDGGAAANQTPMPSNPVSRGFRALQRVAPQFQAHTERAEGSQSTQQQPNRVQGNQYTWAGCNAQMSPDWNMERCVTGQAMWSRPANQSAQAEAASQRTQQSMNRTLDNRQAHMGSGSETSSTMQRGATQRGALLNSGQRPQQQAQQARPAQGAVRGSLLRRNP